MKKPYAPNFIGSIRIAGGLILFAFPIAKGQPATPTIKVPGAYPYEETVRIPTPPQTLSESSVLPTPAPILYRETSPSLSASQDHGSRRSVVRRSLTPKAAREVAFKHNGVPYFCGFLAALPADVSVFDPKLGTTRPLVSGGHVVGKNVAWLRKSDKTHPNSKPTERTLVSVEELGGRTPGS